jgi:hypothetical protein
MKTKKIKPVIIVVFCLLCVMTCVFLSSFAASETKHLSLRRHSGTLFRFLIYNNRRLRISRAWFPNGAGNGARERNLSNMELVRVREDEHVTIFLYPINNFNRIEIVADLSRDPGTSSVASHHQAHLRLAHAPTGKRSRFTLGRLEEGTLLRHRIPIQWHQSRWQVRIYCRGRPEILTDTGCFGAKRTLGYQLQSIISWNFIEGSCIKQLLQAACGQSHR